MKRTLCAILALSFVFTLSSMAFTFEHLDRDDLFSPEVIEQEKVSEWAKEEIDKAIDAGLVTPHTSDYMTKDITRFQFAELAVNFAEKATGKEVTPAAADTFTDTSDETVLKAYAAGIVNGVGDGKTFAPDDTTNREQIALMLYRAAQYVKNNGGKAIPDMGTDISKYTDRDSVSLWAKEAVGALANNGVMKGSSDTTLSPAASCSKEQSIILVYRLYEVVK